MAIELEDGTIVRSLPEQVDYLTTHNEENEIAIDNLAARLEAAIAGVLHYKGSVATYSDLPADAEIGDVYNVIDTGANYAWTGSEWDELGSSIDISSLVDLTSAQTITGIKTFSNGIKTDDIEGIGTEMLIGRVGYPIKARSGIRPNSSGSIDLGAASSQWRRLYLTSGLNFGTDGGAIERNISNISITAQLGDITFKPIANGSLRPYDSGDYDLGSFTYKWKDLYLNGKEYIGTSVIYTNNTNLFFQLVSGTDAYAMYGSAFVGIGGNRNLGTNSNKWADLYLSGNISDGTNSVTVAEIGKKLLSIESQRHLTTGEAKQCVGGVQVVSDYFLNLGNDVLIKNPYITGMSVTATTVDITAVGLNTSSQMTFHKARLALNASDDSIAVTESNITTVTLSDIENLITYAKAQGWIS